MRKTRYYVTLTVAERRLVLDAMRCFRNKVLSRGIDTVDIDWLIQKLQRRLWL